MTLICPRCSRPSPPQALYCFLDGSALPTRAQFGPANRSAAGRFPRPFLFPSGKTCHTFDELALAILDDWSASAQLLRRNDLTAFLAGLGRADLALAAREASRFPDPDRGLDQLLWRLPTSVLQAPHLNVEPRQINLGQLRPGLDRPWELHLSNQGMGLLYGTVSCEGVSWLGLGDAGLSTKRFQFLHDGIIVVHVRGKELRASGQPLQGLMTIESNGGTLAVVVGGEVPIKPFPPGVLGGAISPRQVAQKAKASPKEAARLFENGSVARWYQDNGWTYPVPGPSASGLGAVQQFFEALGLTAPPKVEISDTEVSLTGRPGELVTHSVTVSTAESRPVYAHGVSDQQWLRVGRASLNGRTATLKFFVPSVPDEPGEVLLATATVTANGNQRFEVPVSLEVRSSPRAEPVLDVVPAPVAVPEAPPRKPRPEPRRPRDDDPAEDAPRPPKSGGVAVLLALVPVSFLVLGMVIAAAHDLIELAKDGTVFGGPVSEEILLEFHNKPENYVVGEVAGMKNDGGHRGRTSKQIYEPSMRFGVLLPDRSRGGQNPGRRLTFHERGLTNNACVRLNGQEYVYGDTPMHDEEGIEMRNIWPNHWAGRWTQQERVLGRDGNGRATGVESIWYYDRERVTVTQTVEIVPGPQTEKPDTCLVRYRVQNGDQRNVVGLRFLLDTFIGENDGVPFLLPGSQQLCSTKQEFNGPQEVPAFLQALERDNLSRPGTVAHLQLKLGGGIEPPSRVTLGAWPNNSLQRRDPRCHEGDTLWDVPVLSIQDLNPRDSAVTMYWPERQLGPRESFLAGFSYGLGSVSGGEGHGKLALTAGGSFTPGGEFTVTAYVQNPSAGQTVKLTLPQGLEFVGGSGEQAVPPPAQSGGKSPVTWKIKAGPVEGTYPITATTAGVTQSLPVKIKTRNIFGAN